MPYQPAWDIMGLIIFGALGLVVFIAVFAWPILKIVEWRERANAKAAARKEARHQAWLDRQFAETHQPAPTEAHTSSGQQPATPPG